MRGLLTIASILLLVGFTISGSAAGQPPSVNGLIAFDRYDGPTLQVWLMDQDGSHPRPLTNGRWPAWSSDGTRLAYITNGGHLAVINADGEGRHLVPISFADAGDFPITAPAWSPDGTTIAFARNEGLYVVSSDGGTATRLAVGSEPAPAWSPDGAHIAYLAQDGALTVMGADGTDAEVVPQARGTASRSVAWTPDGSEIAYGNATSGGLSTVRLDGSPPTTLIASGVNSLSDPAWSPDGRRIAFFDNAEICVANADGSDVGRLTYTPEDVTGVPEQPPAWQPLPPGSTPAGPPNEITGPAGKWNRNQPWYPACRSIWRGLVVTAAAPTRIAAASLVTVTLTVTNQSSTPLGEGGVVALSASVRNGSFVRITPTQGNCPVRQTHMLDCELGALFPGQRAQIRLRLRAGNARHLVLRCYLPRPAEALDTTPIQPDCMRDIRVQRA